MFVKLVRIFFVSILLKMILAQYPVFISAFMVWIVFLILAAQILVIVQTG